MGLGRLMAGVQYGDWHGTAAADDADQIDLRAWLESKNLYDRDTEFLIATEIYIGENHGGVVQPPYVSAIIAKLSDYESTDRWLNQTPDPIPVRRVEIEISIEEFIGLFKRFNVVLTWRDLKLQGREYQY